MNVLKGTARLVSGAGETAVATVGAVGGAAVGSVGGSVRGAVEGALGGARYGRRSTPVALATMGAVGAAGLVEWPIVLAAGGTALALRLAKPAQPERSGAATVGAQQNHAGTSPPAPASAPAPTAGSPPADTSPRRRAKPTPPGHTTGSAAPTVPAQPHP
ncbi:hypothetical protein [Rhodococcus phenolicus]|uniref:hypothetical protein n=1 Tax=Rhodococcus phenolicus TaxID=263849 RepID=UPI00082D363D|nr:hypothetical protein [Rhodococcus phenolicus]